MLSFETQIHFAFLRILQVGTPKPKKKGEKLSLRAKTGNIPQAYEHLWKRHHNVGLKTVILNTR